MNDLLIDTLVPGDCFCEAVSVIFRGGVYEGRAAGVWGVGWEQGACAKTRSDVYMNDLLIDTVPVTLVPGDCFCEAASAGF